MVQSALSMAGELMVVKAGKGHKYIRTEAHQQWVVFVVCMHFHTAKHPKAFCWVLRLRLGPVLLAQRLPRAAVP
jgi:hypothetical protein